MNTLSIILITLSSILSIAVIVLFILLFNLKKEVFTLKRYNNKIFTRLTSVMKDMQSMSNTTYGIGKQMNNINDHVKNLDARQDELDLRDQSDKPIQQAIALVERGANLEEIMSTCHLSQSEAELLFRIHGDYE